MPKFSLCLMAVVVLSAAALAAPKAEIFGGYQFAHLEGDPNMNGWNGALTGNLGKFFGITADFSGAYGSGTHFYTYTFGPEVHAHLPVVKPFVHALFGGYREVIPIASKSIQDFAMYVGGGIDAGHGPLAWRVAQIDWMNLRQFGANFGKNVRISTGLVIRF
jgi:hypothetical protein